MFELSQNVNFDDNYYGKKNKCETNVFDFIKYENLLHNKTHYFPVGGYLFEGYTFEKSFPIEHWWIYDSKLNIFKEITPPINKNNTTCYTGIINYNINNDIYNSKKVFDVDFFKGGYVYYKYFKNK